MEKTKTAMCLNLCTILGMAGMIWFIWYGIDNRLFVSSESLQAFLDRFGLFAPALFILIQMVQVVIPILPGAIGCLGGVLIFGPVWGFVYNYVGIAMGSVLAFLLSKHYGRPFVHHIIGEKNYNKYIGWLDKGKAFDKAFAVAIFLPVAPKGYKLILTMPETMSVERRNILKAYGAEIVLTEGAKGMTGAIEKAKELAERISGSFLAGQFDNPANPAAHIVSTGPEIWEDTDGNVDVFVAGVGTGGTITGVGGYLKEKKKSVKIVAVEPSDSPVLSKGTAGPHKIQGIGAGFVPTVLNTQIYDEIMPITAEKSFETAKLFAHKEGILVGISSGAALYAAIEQAKREENKGKTIVALLPDSGDRYYSTPLFES